MLIPFNWIVIESIDEKNRYIPKRIFEDIKSLVEQHPEGFRSTELISIYEVSFPIVLVIIKV